MNAVKFAIPHTVSWVIALMRGCEEGKVTQHKQEAMNRALENGQGNKETNNNDYLENEMEKISNIDLFKLIFTQSIEYSIEKVKNSQNDIYYKSGNKQELSNIKPYNDSKEDTIALPDNSDVSSNDIITKENSLRYIINLMSKKKKRLTLNKKIKNKKTRNLIF